MNPSDADESSAHAEDGSDVEQQRKGILTQFRLLESAVQSTQLQVGGQVVVPVQEVLGTVLSAKADFENSDSIAVEERLRQAAESFRFKAVRWESEARAAQAGQRPLSEAQKKHLSSEISVVRAAARKTQIFFDRVMTAVAEWHETVGTTGERPTPTQAEPEPKAAAPKPAATREPESPAGGGGFTLRFSLTSTKLFPVKAVDVRKPHKLVIRFRNSSIKPATVHVQMFNRDEHAILTTPAELRFNVTKAVAVRELTAAADTIDPSVPDTHAVLVKLIEVPDDIDVVELKIEN